MTASLNLDAVRFDKDTKTVVVVAQDVVSGRVLMVANADREALERTIETGEMHYRSRTRGLWRKGATSGNVQKVVSLTPDCDSDAIVARVRSAGPACHTGAVSCFEDSAGAPSIWSALATTISQRNAELKARPEADAQSESKSSQKRRSHTRELLLDRNLRLKKIGEESGDGWDAIALVEYPSRQAFIDMVSQPDYQKAHTHREAGLERTVLLATASIWALLGIVLLVR